MNRPYYDNPWVAGYMMTVHGIPLMWLGQSFLHPVTLEMLTDDIDAGSEWRYYVRPDAVAMLEPQKGDIVARYLPEDGGVFMTAYHAGPEPKEIWNYFRVSKDISVAVEQDAIRQWRTIQRDGKPFHWPKEEA